ncbi:MAG: energy transducer TonB [Prosthecobacter sp.]|nr:energy transducer TonB [Prosthecobacter sp.]
MSPTALIGSTGLDLQQKAAGGSRSPALVRTWRLGQHDENLAPLSWVVAIAASFLLIGVIGLFQKEMPLEITLGGRAGQGASDTETTELTMAELHAMEETPEVTEEQILPAVVPIADPIEVLQDLPELAEALVTEDVFTVPAAPKIEEALRPVDPAKPRPRPQPAPARPRASRATTMASGTQGGTQGSGGGAGGSGAVGAGSGSGKFPKPNYPSSARARGVSGLITLALTIGPAGKVEDAAAISSNGGFTSGEQDTVASYVERNWRFPTGAYRKHTVNIVFNLSSR